MKESHFVKKFKLPFNLNITHNKYFIFEVTKNK